MRQTIKIVLIALVAVAIVALLFFFTRRISDFDGGTIAPKPFLKYVEGRTNSEIIGKPYDEAKAAFDALIGEVETEAFITHNDSLSMLSASEKLKCEKVLFFGYAPIFADYGKGYFQQNTWADEKVNAIKQEAERLKAFDIAQSGTELLDGLDYIGQVVKNYTNAKSVIYRASYCTTIDAVRNIIASANALKKEPLTNNTSLIASLNNVPRIAKEALAGQLVRNASGVIQKYMDGFYRDYASWYSDFVATKKSIEEYESAFGQTQILTLAKKNLMDADDVALDSFD